MSDEPAKEAPHTYRTDQNRVDEALRFVANRSWRISDNDFFNDLVIFLGKLLNVNYAFCNQIIPHDITSVKSLALYANGKIAPNISYALEDTPCDNVVGQTVCAYVDNVQKTFPKDLLLVEMNAECYVGVPLWASDGTPLGLLAIIDDKPLQDPSMVQTILQIFAVRAGAELETSRVLDKLKESEQRFKDFSEASGDWLWEMGPDLRFTFVSDRIEDITGSSPSAFIGKTRDEVAGTLDLAEEWDRHLEILARNLPFKNFQYRIEDKSGTPKYLSISGVPVFSRDGIFSGYRGVGSDITAAKLTEIALHERQASLRAVFDNTPVCLNLKDTEGRYLVVNKPYEEWLGHPATDIIGRTASEILDGSDEVKNLTKAERAVIESGKPHESEIHVERANGEIFDRILIKFPVNAKDGSIIGLGTAAIDITERKRAEASIQSARKEAELANKAKSEFLASMSHELRTPLNAVLGYGQLLQLDLEKTLSTTQKEYIEYILSSGEHVLGLINDVLDLARIDAGRMSVFLEVFSPTDIIQETISSLSISAQANNVSFHFDSSILKGVELRSDPIRFRQIVINLITNAIKYNRPGGEVRITGEDTKDGYFRLAISDSGIGIPASKHKKLFTMFNRLTEHSHHAVEGTGIGLYVSKMLSDRLAGRLDFESEEGVGSKFWLDIPLASNKNVLIWTDKMRVGIDAIDKDHQMIFNLTNKISQPDIPESDLDSIIHEMIAYTSYHFRREEAIMEVCDYPDFMEHRERHHKLEAYVNELALEWRQTNDTAILGRLKSFLRNWWSGHIIDVDMTLSEYTVGKETQIEKKLAHTQN